MFLTIRGAGRRPAILATCGAALILAAAGCTSQAPSNSYYLFQPILGENVGRTTGGTGEESGGGSGFFGGGSRTNTDPCQESTSRKFVRISMRNAATLDFIHYFVAFVAFVQSDIYPDGAVCPDDTQLYTDFGYEAIDENEAVEFGNYCIVGPALLYYHRGGQFRTGSGSGNSNLASAIAPAQGTSATYDNFFRSGGAQVPVPNIILFHNPGTGAGASLKVTPSDPAPCTPGTVLITVGDCDQDAFYYVDTNDLLAGSTRPGTGSAVRTPNEIQGTGCECGGGGTSPAAMQLAPSSTRATDARCYEFLRGGNIDFVFLRNDTNPPFPQAVWRVTDAGGAEVHAFDERANIP